MTAVDRPDNITDELEPSTGGKFSRTVAAATAGVAIVALAGLAGYLPGLRVLGSMGSDYVPMAQTTAACFLLYGTVLFLHTRKLLHGVGYTVITLLTLLATLFCLLELVELFVGADLNFSTRLFPATGMVGKIPVGFMSPATAATFSLSGLGVLLLMFRRRSTESGQPENWASGMGALTALVGATILLAYLYGNPFMYDGSTIPMAATTAIAFIFLGIALVASTGPESFLMRRVTGESTHAILARVFFPLIVSAIILQSILSRYFETSFMIHEALIKALFVVIIGMITASVVDRVARSTGNNIDEVNRKLHQTLNDLQESEEHHRSILQTAMDGVWLVNTDGRLLEVNNAYCRMSGYSERELLSMGISDLEANETASETSANISRIMTIGESRFESRHRRKDGSLFDVEVSIMYRPFKGGQLVAFVHDITERKLKESAHHQADLLLQLANTHGDLHACMSALTDSLQSWSGCEAVGIRLRDGDDYPYFETRGFPATFIQAENHLCAYGPDGKVLRDGMGNPVLECMCGNILCGRFDPAEPFFTARGSFWSNNTTALLASSTEAERQSRTRNRCNGEGYESVALIPMHAGDRIIGLMQFNDHRQNRFTPALINIFEGMADNLALTLVRRQVENALFKSESHFRTLVNTIPDLIWLKDVDGVYLSCNARFESFFAAKEADIVGKTDYDFVDKDLADFFRDHDRAAMLANEPSSNEEWVTFADDGHRALLYTTKTPMYDAEGTLVGVLGVGRDITELKQAEEAMRESDNRLRLALEGTNDGLWDVQLKTGKTYLSPRGCEILGYGGDELNELLEVWSDLVHPDDLHLTEERLQAHMEGRTAIFEVEQRLRTRSGDWKWIHTRGKVVERHPDGTPLRITGTHSDITEKKILESQLYQAQKMESVGSLAGGVAHDFNNKLSVILGHTYLALGETDPAKLHDSLEEIRKAAEQSADLTQQLLAFARKQTIAPKVLDLNETVASMLKMLQRLIGENIRLIWQPAPDLWLLKFDSSQIDQILANLCVNARDSIGNGGKITIETGNSIIDEDYCSHHGGAAPGGYVRLVVTDNGCGMDKETQARIFEPFFTTKGIGKGTGLGLATVYGIVKQNNGFINVYSEPGHGTTFTIYLPRHTGKSVEAPKAGITMPAPRGLETILLAEDEWSILNMATMILTRQGYQVLQANSAAEAIRQAQEHRGEISLFITDVIMPDMNGNDLALNLKSKYPQLKCLFMSGYTADIIGQHGVLGEGVHFIQKPFSLHDLATKVREILDNQVKE
jgi:PAS domain S-box-containing protein